MNVIPRKLRRITRTRRRLFFKRLPAEMLIIFKSLLPVIFLMCFIGSEIIQVKAARIKKMLKHVNHLLFSCFVIRSDVYAFLSDLINTVRLSRHFNYSSNAIRVTNVFSLCTPFCLFLIVLSPSNRFHYTQRKRQFCKIADLI